MRIIKHLQHVVSYANGMYIAKEKKKKKRVSERHRQRKRAQKRQRKNQNTIYYINMCVIYGIGSNDQALDALCSVPRRTYKSHIVHVCDRCFIFYSVSLKLRQMKK